MHTAAQIEQEFVTPMTARDKARTLLFLSMMVVMASSSTFAAMFFSGLSAF